MLKIGEFSLAIDRFEQMALVLPGLVFSLFSVDTMENLRTPQVLLQFRRVLNWRNHSTATPRYLSPTEGNSTGNKFQLWETRAQPSCVRSAF